jgi:FecR protein
MIPSGLSQTWCRYLGGAPLTERERSALIAACRDEQEREHLLADLRLDGMLRAHGAGLATAAAFARACSERVRAEDDAPAAELFAAGIRSRLRAEPETAAPAAWRVFARWGAAALLLICAGVLGVALLGHTGRARPILAALSGEVQLTTNGHTRSAHPGDLMAAGDRLTVAPGGSASWRYDDGSACALSGGVQASAPNSALFPAAVDGIRVVLEAGTLSAEVAKQPAGRPMRIESPAATAEIVGTAFTLGVGADGTRLTVSSGRVRLIHGGDQVEVAGGETAVADALGRFARVHPGGDLVTAITPGRARTDWVGWNGARLTVGAQPLLVSALARLRLDGNHGTQPIKLLHAENGSAVPGGQAEIDFSTPGPAHALVYAALAQPVLLAAHRSYYLVTRVDGREPWCHSDSVVATTSAASIDCAVYSLRDRWREEAGVGHCFGPVGLRYDQFSEPLSPQRSPP